MPDNESLLAQYVQKRSDAAFKAIVDSYIDLVYSAAVRLVGGDTHRAQDIVQIVFFDLAQTAPKLAPATMLGGWLHRHTCFVASNVIRQERRRQAREQQAVEMNTLHETVDFSSLAPILDDAINELEEKDRTAILLRFFEQRDFRAVGEVIGVGEDGARMRVNRALEKLESNLKRRGITATATALAVALSANAIEAAPTGLAAAVSVTAAAACVAAKTTAAASLSKAIAMTTFQKTIIGTACVALIGVGIFEVQQNSTLREQVRTYRDITTPQLEQLQAERDENAKQLAALRAENNELKNSPKDLQRLRAEARKLRESTAELARTKNNSNDDSSMTEAVRWKQRVDLLKQRVEQNPDVAIPEMKLLTEKDWLDAAKGDLNTDKDFRNALSTLRNSAESKIVNNMQMALTKYIEANSHFPTSLAQLQPYSKDPIDDAVLQRWTIVPARKIPSLGMGGDWIITQAQVPDPELDNRWGIGPSGYGQSGTFDSSTKQPVFDTIGPAIKSFVAANNGALPTEPSQLSAYVTTDEQRALLDKIVTSFKTASDRDKAQMQKELEKFLKDDATN
jgi:RNA polymerase sigma factor (sigma-70 family)